MALPELAVKQSGYGGRGYKNPFTGEIVPSVTTILKAADKPAITQWAVDQTAAYAVANIDSLMSRSELQGWGFLRFFHKRNPLPLEEGIDIRNYHQGVLNDAAELGTSMHEWMQSDVDENVPVPDVSGEPEQFWQMVEVWNQFQSEHRLECLYTELTVWSEKHGYAGTLDGLWIIDGVLTLLDIKTSRGTWPEHYMQLAALAEADYGLVKNADGEWERIEIPAFDDIQLLHIRPDDVENDGTPKPAYIELLPMKHQANRLRQFLGLLEYKKGERAIQDDELAEKKAQKEAAKSALSS